MTCKTPKEIKESVIEDYQKKFPGERLYSKVFSIFVLDKYVRLVSRIYKKADEIKRKEG